MHATVELTATFSRSNSQQTTDEFDIGGAVLMTKNVPAVPLLQFSNLLWAVLLLLPPFGKVNSLFEPTSTPKMTFHPRRIDGRVEAFSTISVETQV